MVQRRSRSAGRSSKEETHVTEELKKLALVESERIVAAAALKQRGCFSKFCNEKDEPELMCLRAATCTMEDKVASRDWGRALRYGFAYHY
jgi:hypothetical protein